MNSENTNTFSCILEAAMFKKKLNDTQLAKLLDCSQSNISKKLRLNNFRESDMHRISEALGYDVNIKLISKETGEELQIP